METRNVALLRSQLAVMNLFRAQHQQLAQGWLDMNSMVPLWPEYGLRSRDLRGAVATLSKRGFVRIVPRDVGERIVMTAAGARWSTSLPAWLEYRLLVPRRSLHRSSHLPGQSALPRPEIDRRAARPIPTRFDRALQTATAA